MKGLLAIAVTLCAPALLAAQPQNSPTYQRIVKEVRHELMLLSNLGVFDTLEYAVDGRTVVLEGQVTRPTLKSGAENVVKKIEGVEKVDNRIEVLPSRPRTTAYVTPFSWPWRVTRNWSGTSFRPSRPSTSS